MNEIPQFVTFVVSMLAAGLGVSAYTFGAFETKEAARRSTEILEARLERIETKVDRLIEWKR